VAMTAAMVELDGPGSRQPEGTWSADQAPALPFEGSLAGHKRLLRVAPRTGLAGDSNSFDSFGREGDEDRPAASPRHLYGRGRKGIFGLRSPLRRELNGAN